MNGLKKASTLHMTPLNRMGKESNLKNMSFNKIAFTSNENVPWTFRLKKGKIVDDSDIGPTNSGFSLQSVRKVLRDPLSWILCSILAYLLIDIVVDCILLNLTSLTSVCLLIGILLYQFADSSSFNHFPLSYYIISLTINFTIEILVEVCFHKKSEEQKMVWLTTRYMRFDASKDRFVKTPMQDLAIGDLVLIKKGYLAPADILVFESGTTRGESSVFKVSEDNLGSLNSFRHKTALRKFEAPRKAPNKPYHWLRKIKDIVPQLSGVVNYRSPNTSSEVENDSEDDLGVLGTFKFTNDPKAELIHENNMLFFGSKLSSSWVFGIILYTGMNTVVLRKLRKAFNLKNRFFKKYGKFRIFNNFMALIYLIIYIAQAVFTILSFTPQQLSFMAVIKFRGHGVSNIQKAIFVALQMLVFFGQFNSAAYNLSCLISILQVEDRYKERGNSENQLKSSSERFPYKKTSIDPKKLLEGISDTGSSLSKFKKSKENSPERKKRKIPFPTIQRSHKRPAHHLRGINSKKGASHARIGSRSSNKKESLLHNLQSPVHSERDFLMSKKSIEKPLPGNYEDNLHGSNMEASRYNQSPVNDQSNPKRSTLDISRANLDMSVMFKSTKDSKRLNREKRLKERNLQIFNKNSLFDLGTIKEAVFAKAGVLTTGDTRIGAFTTTKKIYSVEIEKLAELKKRVDENPGQFKFEEEEEQSFEEREEYSEKSQEYGGELNGEFVSKVFDEDTLNLDDVLSAIDKNEILQIKKGEEVPVRSPRHANRRNFGLGKDMNSKNSESTTMGKKTTSVELEMQQASFLMQIQNMEKKFKERVMSLRSGKFQMGRRMTLGTRNMKSSRAFSVNTFNFDENSHGNGEEEVLIETKTSKFEESLRLMADLSENKQEIDEFMKGVLLCHEKSSENHGNENVYRYMGAADQAIFKFLNELGYSISVSRELTGGVFFKTYSINNGLFNKKYNILGINSYDKRERMSIIVKDPEKGKFSFKIYVKGTFEAMEKIMLLSKKDAQAYRQIASAYKVRGLTPVVYASKTLSSKDIMGYITSGNHGVGESQEMSSLSKRLVEVKQTKTHQFEQNVRFLGCLGNIEVIREDSKRLIESLKSASININVFTRARLTDVLDIAKRLEIIDLDSSSGWYMLKAGDRDELINKLDRILGKLYDEIKDHKINEIEEIKKSEDIRRGKRRLKFRETHHQEREMTEKLNNQPRTLILSGKALRVILKDPALVTSLHFLLQFCSTVLGFDFESSDKLQMISFLKIKHRIQSSILAIGEGSKDSSMLMEADIGIELASKDLNLAIGDMVIKNLSSLEKLIFVESKNFMVSQLLGLVILTWTSFSLATITLMAIKNDCEFGLFGGFYVIYYYCSVFYLVFTEIFFQNFDPKNPISKAYFKELYFDKVVFLRHVMQIAGVLLVSVTVQSFFIDNDFKLVVSRALSSEGYESHFSILMIAIFLLMLSLSCLRVAFFKIGLNNTSAVYKSLAIIAGFLLFSTAWEVTLSSYLQPRMPVASVFFRRGVYLPLTTTLCSVLLVDFAMANFIKMHFITPVRTELARLAEQNQYKPAEVAQKIKQFRKRKTQPSAISSYYRAKEMLKNSRVLPASLKQFFNLDLSSTSLGINQLTCEISNESQLRLFKIFSKKRSFEEYKEILILAFLGCVVKLLSYLFKPNRVELFLKTGSLYEMVIFGVTFLGIHFKSLEKKKGSSGFLNSIGGQELIFYCVVGSILVEFALNFLNDVSDFGDDISILCFIGLKMTVAPMNFDYTKTLILLPMVSISYFIWLAGLGDEIKLYTLEYKVRVFGVLGLILIAWLIIKYKHQFLIKAKFLGKLRIKTELDVSSEKISILLPPFVVDKMHSYEITQNFMADDAGEITVIFCDICHFQDLVYECQDMVIDILDDVFRAFDSYCKKEGVQKIETVGKTYMACGGLKFLESSLTPEQRKTNATKRVVNVARKMLQFIKTYNYKPGKKLFIKIGIHRGNCILGLLGFHKPQFSLIGDTINTTSRHCTTGQTSSIVLSAEARNHLGGDRDVRFNVKEVWMKGKGMAKTYILRENLGKKKVTGFGDLLKKNFGRATTVMESTKKPTVAPIKLESILTKAFLMNLKKHPTLKSNGMEESESGQNGIVGSLTEQSKEIGVEKRLAMSINKSDSEIESESLEEDDRDNKDPQGDGGRRRSGVSQKGGVRSNRRRRTTRRRSGRNSIFRKLDSLSIRDNKDEGTSKPKGRSKEYVEYYMKSIFERNQLMISLLCCMLALDSLVRLICFTIDNNNNYTPGVSRKNFPWSRAADIFLVLYFSLVSYTAWMYKSPLYIKYGILGGSCLRLCARILELLIAVTLDDLPRLKKVSLEMALCSVLNCSIISCCVLLTFTEVMINNFVMFSSGMICLLLTWEPLFTLSMFINFGTLYAFNVLESFKYFKIQTESFDRFLEIERESYKMSQFVGRLLPKHIQNVVGTVGAKVGESYEEVTLLFADIVGFTKFSSTHSSRGVVEMLSRLFINFDIECQKLDLFKIYTIGDCYVVMGFTDKNNRKDPSEEAHNVVKLGIKMIEIIQKVRKNLRIDLNMRIGIHTGSVIAGIIGTDLVRFDIYGKDVLIANKMESNGEKGKICVSQATREYLDKLDTYRMGFEEHKTIEIEKLGEKIKSYFVKLD